MKYHTVQDEVSDRLMVEEIKYKVKQKDMVGFIKKVEKKINQQAQNGPVRLICSRDRV